MSYPKKINATYVVKSELEEHKLINYLELLGYIDLTVFPNTEHLKDNANFKKLIKAKKEAGLELDRFINNNRK